MTLPRVVCVMATIFSWFGIRFLRFIPRGRTTDAAPDNVLRFPRPLDSAIRIFCARPLSVNDLKPFGRREQPGGPAVMMSVDRGRPEAAG